jgi:hypothetical protein
VVSVTLWENEAALQATQAATSQDRAPDEQALGIKVVDAEQFEVIGEA